MCGSMVDIQVMAEIKRGKKEERKEERKKKPRMKTMCASATQGGHNKEVTKNSDASSKNLKSELKKKNYDAVETSLKSLKVSRKSSTQSTSESIFTCNVHNVTVQLRPEYMATADEGRLKEPINGIITAASIHNNNLRTQ